MKGKIVRFTEQLTEWNKLSFDAIVIDYRKGYTVRKSWGNKGKFIDCPLIKIYWLYEPPIKPPSALRRMSADWNMDPQYSFGFAENNNNYIIDDWDEFKSEWYYLDIFEVIK
jgi:hypothetical protein